MILYESALKKTTTTGKPPKKQQGPTPAQEYLLAGAIAGFTLLLYLHSLKSGFVDWDDTGYLRDNPAVQHLDWEHLKTIFTSFYSGNYHPLTTLTYAFEYAVSGFNSATLYHFNNLWLHLVNVWLVYWFIRLISRNVTVAAIVAFWFGIHPMHVESVAWISERKDLLYGGFFLASLVSYCYYLREQGFPGEQVRGTAGGKRKFYLFSLFFFLLSLLSKSAAVVLPLVLLLVDFLMKRKFTLKQLSEKIPFFALAMLFGILAILSQGSAIHRGMDLDLSPVNRFFTVNYAIMRYVAFLFFPAGLSAYHPYPVIGQGGEGVIIYLSVLFNLAIIAAAVWSLKYSGKWFFGFLFFLVNIVLVLQILPVGGAFMAERYTYISYIGLFYIVACLLTGATEKSKQSSPRRMIPWALFILFSIFFSVTAYQRIGTWADSLALFDDVVKKYPDNHLAYYLRASARKDTDLAGAIADYNKSVALKPENPDAYNNLGNIYSAGGKYKEALADYNAALRYDPALTEALNNRGAVKAILGDLDGALVDINKALKSRPDYRDAYRNRGLVRLQMKDIRSAREDWIKAAGMGDELSVKFLDRYPEK